MKSSSSLTCIVPRIPPSVDGVGDYALNLALHLYKDSGLKTHFIVTDPNWVANKQLDDFRITQITTNSADNLSRSLSTSCSSTVLLHYVGYGYAKRGCPLWLAEGLKRWKKHASSPRLVTMFHELYASGPPWTSSFWLSPVQKHLVTRLSHLSDSCLTSKQLYADLLFKLAPEGCPQLPVLPVFSTVGEPTQVLPLAKRSPQLVVFGGRASRLRVYQDSAETLIKVCQSLGIKKILDIGPPTGLNLSFIKEVSVVERGPLPVAEISHILSHSLAGFLTYSPSFLAKSTIFAAYCAHGVVIINSAKQRYSADGIEAGKYYWAPDMPNTALKDLTAMQAIADSAYAWYQAHNLQVHAKTFAACLGHNS
ncbi:glycosyltransferase family 1 protein [Trichocoleus sp. FACHB-591]|uniref:glycosyltransferase family 1 protein n=1 Tax=Trichocoleus sp. FACHB-591 TaxID=2692872 RepID=UPI0016886693|nr:glycosyltransferase family 1 protein [Trichocoleus sp. FACHB-591]MBD2093917.1 glycosyltransferase family 1 protein [Trichocoleus sp. FACHB-591]